jgi:hypothetical protein
MDIPLPADFAAWNAGQLSDCQIILIEAFFAQMLAGAEALGPRYALATLALRAEHDAARSMLDRRRKPHDPCAVTSVLGPDASASTAIRQG